MVLDLLHNCLINRTLIPQIIKIVRDIRSDKTIPKVNSFSIKLTTLR